MAGGGKKGGFGLPSNGCLRYLVLYLLALALLMVCVVGSGSGLLSRLGLPGIGSGGESEITISSSDQPAPEVAPEQASDADLPPNSGGSAPESAGIAELTVAGAPVASNQAGLITSYQSPAFYIVQDGDTLGGIALAYGTTPGEIGSYNRLASDSVFPGQVLYLPPGSFQPVPGTGRNAGDDDQP